MAQVVPTLPSLDGRSPRTMTAQKEKERIYDMLMTINASQSNTWDDIKK